MCTASAENAQQQPKGGIRIADRCVGVLLTSWLCCCGMYGRLSRGRTPFTTTHQPASTPRPRTTAATRSTTCGGDRIRTGGLRGPRSKRPRTSSRETRTEHHQRTRVLRQQRTSEMAALLRTRRALLLLLTAAAASAAAAAWTLPVMTMAAWILVRGATALPIVVPAL